MFQIFDFSITPGGVVFLCQIFVINNNTPSLRHRHDSSVFFAFFEHGVVGRLEAGHAA